MVIRKLWAVAGVCGVALLWTGVYAADIEAPTFGDRAPGGWAPAVSPYEDGRVLAAGLEVKSAPRHGAQLGAITVDVYASSAPNAYGSPSWAGYLVKALYALENGLAVNGTRATDPTAYERAPALVLPGEIAVTSFKSWRGVVEPAAPFDNEYGNRMHFGLHAHGDGTAQFKLEDLTFELHSSDPGDSLVYAGDFIGYSYNGTTRYGIDWGADRAKGGGDDTVYTSGNGTTLVDEIVYVGVGNAWWPGGDDPNPANPAGGKQAAMDDYFAWIASDGPINVTCTYDILGNAGSDAVLVSDGTLTLDADDECYAVDDTVTVEINMRDILQNVVGGQFFLAYDTGKLSFVSADPGDSPFTVEVFEAVPGDGGAGTIDYAVSALSGDPGVSGTKTMAVLTFTAEAAICSETDLITWRAHDPPTRLSDALGGPIYPELIAMDVSDTEDPVITCPANMTVECDESTLPANTGSATATDNCDPDPAITYADVETAGTCPQEKTITRTWTATDHCGNVSTCVQTITVEDTTAPDIECPDDVTIECDESTDPLNTGVTLRIPFDVDPILSPTQAPGVWYTDRYPPYGFVRSFFAGDDRLMHSINAADGANFRPGGYTSAFYNTQGRKYDLPAATTRMTIDLYVPADWATTGRRMAGLWGTAVDSSDAISSYPIIEFASCTLCDYSSPDPGTPRFRAWDINTGVWYDMGLPTGFTYEAWYTLEIELVANSWVYTVSDLQQTVAEDPAYPLSVRIANVILQGHNNATGVTYDIYWDDFVASQTARATDNCDGSPTVAYTDVPSLGGCDGTGTITRTWTATDDCGNASSCVQNITVEDTTDPVIACPSDVTIECDESTLPADTGSATATDNCDGSVTPTYGDVETTGACPQEKTITRTWTATDDCGNFASCEQVITVQDTTDPVLTDCPDDITTPADAGTCGAVVTYTPPTATDNCDTSPTVVCTPSSGWTFPSGTTTVTCTATDDCGNSSECSFDVTVDAVNEMVVDVQLQPAVVPGPFNRCITFDLWECSAGSTPDATASAVLTFTGGLANATIEVACGDYECVTARDKRHTLRRTDGALGIVGTQYVADFTGDPATGGDWLIGGNLNDDRWIDILDFGVFSSQWLVNYGSGNTTCSTAYPHADINGDGVVDNTEFSFIQVNFLKSHEANCCGMGGVASSDEPGPVEQISVEELRALGLAGLAAGDLNGDGRLDMEDVVAFTQGARPNVGTAPENVPAEKRNRAGNSLRRPGRIR